MDIIIKLKCTIQTTDMPDGDPNAGKCGSDSGNLFLQKKKFNYWNLNCNLDCPGWAPVCSEYGYCQLGGYQKGSGGGNGGGAAGKNGGGSGGGKNNGGGGNGGKSGGGGSGK